MLLSLLALPPAAFAGGWWNGDWQFRKSITVQLPPAATGGAPAVVVPIRLHAGNFGFFSDVQPSGADLRFISSDGNALNFQVELLDPVVGLLVAWVEVPVRNTGPEQTIFMYYGNPKATAPDTGHLYDADQVLVLHFGESQGVPRDATAYHYDAAASTAFLGTPGVIGNGARFDGHDVVRIPERPALAIAENGSLTFSAWIQAESGSTRAVLYSQQQKDRRVEVGISGPKLYAEIADGKRINRVESANPLPASGWHHVAASIGNEIALYVDGTVAGTGASGGLPAVNGEVLIGGLDDPASNAGFNGQMDEVQISRVARSAWWTQVSAQSQSPDSAMIGYGKDESKGAAGKLAAYFSMMGNLLKQVSLDGLAVIVVTTILGLASFGVLFSKASMLARVEREDAKFLGEFPERLRKDAADVAAAKPLQGDAFAASGLYGMYRAGLSGLATALGVQGGAERALSLSPEAIEAVRAALDGAMVEAADRLNSRLVLMTIAIAGAPFLGLLGTVVGVMITFASIAAAGDVNVNTIAPGVAAAMAATVVGLLVAIPSLFGYNWLATRIARRTSAMEVFAAQFLSSVALHALASRQHAGREALERPVHAA
jgi:biopolymer transport protein ExbB